MSAVTGAVGAKLGSMAAGTFGWTAATWSQIGWTAGVLVGTYLFAPDGPDVVTEGSRLGDLKVTSSAYGVDIPKVFGAYRISGNIIWALPLQETRHEETQDEGKGGGGSSSTTIWYTYSATFAVALCEGPIGGIRKIWFGSILVYNDGVFSKGLKSSNVTFYNGTDTQIPNWRIQSNKANTPAYRNIVYIVFNDVKLEDYSNIIPSVTCEVVKNGDTVNVRHIYAEELRDTCRVFYSWCLNPAPVATVRLYDHITLETTHRKLLEPNITIYSQDETNYIDKRNYTISYDGSIQAVSARGYYADLGYFAHSDGLNYWVGSLPADASLTSVRIFRMNGKVYSMHMSNATFEFTYLFELAKIVIGDTPYPDEPEAIEKLNRPMAHIFQYGSEYIVLGNDDSITLFDDQFSEIKTFNISPSVAFNYNYASGNGMAQLIGFKDNIVYAANLGEVGYDWSFHAIDIENETIEFIGNADDGGGTIANISIDNTFAMIDNYIYNVNIQSGASGTGPSWNIFMLGGITNNGIILSDVVEELLLDCGLSETDFDLSDGLSTEVGGYVISRNMSSRAAIEPLLSAYEFTLVELDHKIVLRKQNQNSIADIIEDDLGANADNNLERNIKQELDLIKSLSVRYANADSDYQTSIQQVRRIDVNAENEIIVELPLVLTDTEAKQLAEKMLYRNWEMRKAFSFALPFSYRDLISGDVVRILLSDSIIEVRLTKITITEDNKLLCEAIANNQDFYESFAIGTDTGINGSEVLDTIGSTTFKILDIPTLHNDYINSEGMYIASTGYTNSWSGCNIYSKQSEVDDFRVELTLLGKMPIGLSLDILPDHLTTIWDLTSLITVFSSEPLYEITIESVLNGNNYALVGLEVIQFSKATDLGNGLYELSWLLRGRRGTEHTTSTHIADEVFIFLKQSTMGFIPKILSNNSYYSALSISNTIDKLEEQIQKQYLGVNLKPFSPSYFNGIRSGNDIILVWNRRSRYISGYMKRLPLVESIESYTLKVYDLNNDLITTITDILTETYTYNSASETRFKIYQVSSIVGIGYESNYLIINAV